MKAVSLGIGGNLTIYSDFQETSDSNSLNIAAGLHLDLSKAGRDTDANKADQEEEDKKAELKVSANYENASRKANKGMRGASTFDILGGKMDPGDEKVDFQINWTRSTGLSPMPTKIEVTPLTLVFQAIGYQQHYQRALDCYAKSGTNTSSTK